MKKLVVGLCLLLGSSVFAHDRNFAQFLDTFAADWMRGDPLSSTVSQFFSGAEQDALDRQLTPVSAAYRAQRVALAKRGLAELAPFDRAMFSPSQRVSAAMFAWQLENFVKNDEFNDYSFFFDQMTGLHVGLVSVLSQAHPVRNARDIENYLARLELVAGVMDDATAQTKAQGERGFLMPKFILTAVIGQFERFLADDAPKNVLTTSLEERAAKLTTLSPEDRTRLVAAAEKIVADSVIPAFRRAQAQLQAQMPNATDDAGLWRLPGGDRAYAQALHTFTTTDMTAEQIHEIGLAEVARIEGEMDGLFRELGYATGTNNERFRQLFLDQQPKDADPRARLLAEYTAIVADAEKRAALLFDVRPKAAIEVRREPVFTEKNAAPHYTPPAPDGTLPGIFWVPLPGPTFGVINMRTLSYHEAVPGHHFQFALQQEMADLPRFRRDLVFGFISAHGEGWALYAEKLAAESGWYEGDKIGRIGQLSSELFRAKRLVVDTGLHAKHWTRQQAIDYGMPVAEVERYVVMPGQACSYKIGELKILELRAKARQALGEKFSLKEFHNVVLRTGGVPLAVLEQVVDDAIAAARR